ncbi:MAG: ABC transporter ATP-binding protein, partial [Chloroflexota bacterium]|nr:ABC transporter ATP-binding protein [Chloroflexota bacterium]
MQNSTILEAKSLSRSYQVGSTDVKALSDISLMVKRGNFYAIVGRSGSGKSTLLNILSGLDTPDSGQVLFEDRDMATMNEKELTLLRRHKIGFVFQSFGLLPLLSAFENVELPMRIAGISAEERRSRTKDVLDMVGLLNRSHHRPYELSGGEQQRVSIARAIVNRPLLILADEPTGELDSSNAKAIFSLFRDMVNDREISVIAVTHDH